MKNVETVKNAENTNNNLFKDFYTVPNLKFDVEKLRSDLDKILKLKKFNSLGIKNFAAIPLNQIPGDKSSIEGHNVRGTYWTIPDETGKEAKRDKPIDESKYTELVQEFKGTYFEEVFNILRKNFKLGRVRILLKEPRSTLSWQSRARLHIPIITNKGCRMVIEDVSKHMPADEQSQLQIIQNTTTFLMVGNKTEYT